MYRVGVIGCRGIGVRHAAGIAMFNDPDRAAVVAACDLVTDEIDAFKGEFPDTEITGYTDHRQMLEKENLDIVTVAPPTMPTRHLSSTLPRQVQRGSSARNPWLRRWKMPRPWSPHVSVMGWSSLSIIHVGGRRSGAMVRNWSTPERSGRCNT